MILEFILLCFSLILLYNYITPKNVKGFPPGPQSYPLVGGAWVLKDLGPTNATKLSALGKIYGPICGLFFGKTPAIIINSYKMTLEMVNSEEFAYRPRFKAFDLLVPGGETLGVFFSNGNLWRDGRRFSLRHLRDFGFGKSSMEGLIHEETEATISSIEKEVAASKDSTIFMHDKFGVSMTNILWAIVGGQRFSHSDEKFLTILEIIRESFRSGNAIGNLINDYPLLRFVPIFNTTFKKQLRSNEEVRNLLKNVIEEHKTTRDLNNPRDFIDVYLNEMSTVARTSESSFTEEHLNQICSDFFNAGSESTSNTVAFNLMYMILNPQVQEKVHAELDRVVGKNDVPSLRHKPMLHYTEAVLTECYRINPIGPISVPRSTPKDTTFHGYTIPKNSNILINLMAIHMDEEYWGDPKVFRPERHLDENGKFVKPERVIPFLLGKRACLGESLARMSVFLLFSGVMHRFKFEQPPGSPKPSEIPMDGFTVAPQPFKAIVTKRFS